MKNLELYKEFYFREIDRKNELTNNINIPILVISGIISVHFYFYNQNSEIESIIIAKLFSLFTILSVFYSIYYLLKSFSNFWKNYDYKELIDMKSIYQYEKDLIEEQKNVENAELVFYKHLKEEISNCTSHNFYLNKIRTEDLAKSKKGIFVGVIFTILFSLTYLFTITFMEKKQENQKPIVKPITTIQGPKSILIQYSENIKKITKNKKT